MFEEDKRVYNNDDSISDILTAVDAPIIIPDTITEDLINLFVLKKEFYPRNYAIKITTKWLL